MRNQSLLNSRRSGIPSPSRILCFHVGCSIGEKPPTGTLMSASYQSHDAGSTLTVYLAPSPSREMPVGLQRSDVLNSIGCATVSPLLSPFVSALGAQVKPAT